MTRFPSSTDEIRRMHAANHLTDALNMEETPWVGLIHAFHIHSARIGDLGPNWGFAEA